MDQTLKKLVDQVFKKNGILSKYFPSYAPRKPQIEMAESVCRCLLEGKNGLIEAGTGTGKSLGYAIATSLWAVHYQKKVVLSTYTVTLQNQLTGKDLPIVKRVLQDLGYSFSFEVAKGRSHYICKRKLDEASAAPAMMLHPKYEVLSKLVNEVDNLERGDRSEIPYDVPSDIWNEIKGDSNDCLGMQSPHYDNCFIQQARAKLHAADVIVSNHAMFFTDLQLKGRGAFGLFPEYDAVVFDEGHRIEDVFSRYFQKTASVRDIDQLFNRFLDKRSLWIHRVLEVLETQDEDIEQEVAALKVKAIRIAHSVFGQLSERMTQLNSTSELLKAPLLERNPFVEVLSDFEEKIKSILQSQEWDAMTTRGLENMIATIDRVKGDFDQLIFNKHADKWANWLEVRPLKGDPELLPEFSSAYQCTIIGAPIEANTVLSDALFKEKVSILTSATLTVAGNFGFMAQRLGIDDYIGFKVSSPFDYESQSMLIIPTDGGDDVEKIKVILSITGGRTFILFTSFVQMRNFKDQLDPWLASQGITPLLHSPSADREQLISQFKGTEKAVLFGAESFWEGVDVPGDDLVCVVIVKLPFAVPDEPLVFARSKKIEESGGSPFEKLMLPGCILRLKQGFGRLVRTKTDRGAVVILDSRVMTKRYGRVILNSMPPAKLSRKLSDLKSIIPSPAQPVSLGEQLPL